MNTIISIVTIPLRTWHLIREHQPFVIALLIFTVLALAGFTWGIPLAISPETLSTWPVDTIAPVRPLTEAFHLFSRKGTDPVVYPLFHFILLDVFYGPYVVLQYLLGGFSNPSSEFPYGIADPQTFFRHLTLIARLVSFFMALGIIYGIYRITDEIASRQAAVGTAVFLALVAPLTYYAKTSNLDVPYLFWSTLAILQFIRAFKYHGIRHYTGFAVFAALAVATKDQAYGFFLLLPFILLYKTAARNAPAAPRPKDYIVALTDRRLLAMATAGIAAFALANNLLFGGLEGFLRHIEFASTFHTKNLKVAYPDMYTLGHQWMLVRQSVSMVTGMLGIGTLVLSLAGIVLSFRDRNWLALTLLVIMFTYYISVIMYAGIVLPRYLLGPVLFLLPFAGIAAHWLFKKYRHQRLSLSLGAVFIVGWQLMLCLNLNLTLIGDSRYPMAEWVRKNIEPGSRIETQVQTRYLPHLSDQYKIDVVGNSLDVITYDVIASELSEQALKRRDPDYILVLQGLGITGDPARMSAPERDYFDALLNEKLGYRVLAKFETPSFLSYKQITAGTQPTSYFLARKR